MARKFYGDIDVNGNKVKGLAAPAVSGDGARWDETFNALIGFGTAEGKRAFWARLEKASPLDPTLIGSWEVTEGPSDGVGAISGINVNSLEMDGYGVGTFGQVRSVNANELSVLYTPIVRTPTLGGDIAIQFVDNDRVLVDLSVLGTARIRIGYFGMAPEA